jgi:hypothetical protein
LYIICLGFAIEAVFRYQGIKIGVNEKAVEPKHLDMGELVVQKPKVSLVGFPYYYDRPDCLPSDNIVRPLGYFFGVKYRGRKMESDFHTYIYCPV